MLGHEGDVCRFVSIDSLIVGVEGVKTGSRLVYTWRGSCIITVYFFEP